MADTQKCIVKLGTPGPVGMSLCGKDVEYREGHLDPARFGTYSGWYHTDSSTDHHAVPGNWIGGSSASSTISCERCGKPGSMRIDPYLSEICDDDSSHALCDACERDRADEI